MNNRVSSKVHIIKEIYKYINYKRDRRRERTHIIIENKQYRSSRFAFIIFYHIIININCYSYTRISFCWRGHRTRCTCNDYNYYNFFFYILLSVEKWRKKKPALRFGEARRRVRFVERFVYIIYKLSLLRYNNRIRHTASGSRPFPFTRAFIWNNEFETNRVCSFSSCSSSR